METRALENAIEILKEKNERYINLEIGRLKRAHDNFIKYVHKNYNEEPDNDCIMYNVDEEDFFIDLNSKFFLRHQEKLESILNKYNEKLGDLGNEKGIYFFSHVQYSLLKLEARLNNIGKHVKFIMPGYHVAVFPAPNNDITRIYFECKDAEDIIRSNINLNEEVYH